MTDFIDFQAKFRATLQQLETVGVQYAEAKGVSWQLQELRKIVLSEEMQKATANTVADRENQARCSQVYKQHVEGTKEAITREHALKAKYERFYAQYEALRSLCAQETARMKIL